MSTKTYSEQRQAIYFRAARDMYRAAEDIALDTIKDEILTQPTVFWAAGVIDSTMRRARDLENAGHEQAVATARQENDLRKARWAAQDAHIRLEMRAKGEGHAVKQLS